MEFKTPKEMYDVLFSKGQDLYNPNLQVYVWGYTDSNGTEGESIAVHSNLSPQKAEELSQMSNGEYWGAYLTGGDPIYTNVMEQLEDLYQAPGWVIADENYRA